MRSRALLLIATLLMAAPAWAEPSEHVITFNQVTVRGYMGLYDTPQLAHLETPGEVAAPSVHGRRPTEPLPDGTTGARTATGLPPTTVLQGRPTNPMAFAPGTGEANPSFVEQGFLVEAFWSLKTGTPEAFFRRAHFHPPNLATGFEAQHLGNPGELHGIYIRSLDGKPFGVRSLKYRVTRNRELPQKPLSITGFSNYNVNILLSRTYDPRWANRVQFTALPVGPAMGNDVTLPWWTLSVTGFEVVDQVYIASSASVDFDDIVLIRFESGDEPVKP